MASKTKRSFTASFKLKVVEVAEQKGKHLAAKAFNVDRRRVQEWCRDKTRLQDAPKSGKRKSGGGRPLRYPDIDLSLMRWLKERRECKVRETGKSLRYEALRLHAKMGISRLKRRTAGTKGLKYVITLCSDVQHILPSTL